MKKIKKELKYEILNEYKKGMSIKTLTQKYKVSKSSILPK